VKPVMDEPAKQVLKGVSRSFYLSLRLLPASMRDAASLGYLLARTSDTLADSEGVPQEVRLEALEKFRESVAGGGDVLPWPTALLDSLPDVRERRLLECSGELVKWLRRLADGEAALVRNVVEIIISGQLLDLDRFSNASQDHPVALCDGEALDDYSWRVAGCVGEFWTKLGFLTLANRFSDAPEVNLIEQGISYGKGLQLVNILRDVAKDLENGRCYLPVADPRNHDEILRCHAIWSARAMAAVGEGRLYAAALKSRRLRAATIMPALIAAETLTSINGSSWEEIFKGIRVSRGFVYRSLFRSFLGT
jgi:farnesyl-diphosphate farnesyltransferase